MSNVVTLRPPTAEESQEAVEVASFLARHTLKDGSIELQLPESEPQKALQLSPQLTELFNNMLMHIARGEMVTIVPYAAQLTTKEAADLLNVSRPYLIKLLNQGDIKFEKIGTHRRIKFTDLMAYKEKKEAEQEKALAYLQELGQEIDF